MKSTCLALLIIVAALPALSSTFAAQPRSEAEKAQLIKKGARLWPIYCGQCHRARPGSEFSPHQWEMIVQQMRTRGNIPAENAEAILEYLKAR